MKNVQNGFNKPLLINQTLLILLTAYLKISIHLPQKIQLQKKISTQNITTDNKPSSNEMTKDDFSYRNLSIKQQKLYEEALSCIQLLF